MRRTGKGWGRGEGTGVDACIIAPMHLDLKKLSTSIM